MYKGQSGWVMKDVPGQAGLTDVALDTFPPVNYRLTSSHGPRFILVGFRSLFVDSVSLNIVFAIASGIGGRIAGGTSTVGDEILGSIVILPVLVSIIQLLMLLVAELLGVLVLVSIFIVAEAP